jgi:hypothetical protein
MNRAENHHEDSASTTNDLSNTDYPKQFQVRVRCIVLAEMSLLNLGIVSAWTYRLIY